MWCHEIPRTFWWHCSQSCVYSDEATWCNAVEKYLLKTPGNGLSQTLTYRMSLDASALKNLCLWCEFQSRLLFIISLLLKTFLTALEITQLRHGSRINTDQFTKRTLKLLGGCADMLPGKFWIWTLSCPLSWVSESFRQDIGQFHSPWMKHPIHFPDFNLESVFIKSIYCGK